MTNLSANDRFSLKNNGKTNEIVGFHEISLKKIDSDQVWA